MKLKRKITKKTWLPLKYWWQKRRKRKQTHLKPLSEVLVLKRRLESELATAERIRDHNKEVAVKAQLNLLNWILYEAK